MRLIAQIERKFNRFSGIETIPTLKHFGAASHIFSNLRGAGPLGSATGALTVFPNTIALSCWFFLHQDPSSFGEPAQLRGSARWVTIIGKKTPLVEKNRVGVFKHKVTSRVSFRCSRVLGRDKVGEAWYTPSSVFILRPGYTMYWIAYRRVLNQVSGSFYRSHRRVTMWVNLLTQNKGVRASLPIETIANSSRTKPIEGYGVLPARAHVAPTSTRSMLAERRNLTGPYSRGYNWNFSA